jgi:hypothetical protein
MVHDNRKNTKAAQQVNSLDALFRFLGCNRQRQRLFLSGHSGELLA